MPANVVAGKAVADTLQLVRVSGACERVLLVCAYLHAAASCDTYRALCDWGLKQSCRRRRNALETAPSARAHQITQAASQPWTCAKWVNRLHARVLVCQAGLLQPASLRTPRLAHLLGQTPSPPRTLLEPCPCSAWTRLRAHNVQQSVQIECLSPPWPRACLAFLSLVLGKAVSRLHARGPAQPLHAPPLQFVAKPPTAHNLHALHARMRYRALQGGGLGAAGPSRQLASAAPALSCSSTPQPGRHQHPPTAWARRMRQGGWAGAPVRWQLSLPPSPLRCARVTHTNTGRPGQPLAPLLSHSRAWTWMP